MCNFEVQYIQSVGCCLINESTAALYHYNMVSKICLDKRRDYGFVDGRRCERKCGILEGSNHTSSCHPSQTTAS